MARKREDRDISRKQKRRSQKPDKRYGEDSKEVDVEALKCQLFVLGLTLREVPGDGNCLFRALGDQLEGHMGNHYRLRQDTTNYMLEHKEDFQPFVEDDIPFEKHVSDLSQLGTYAGNDAIVAFARLRQVTVVIHQPNAPVWQIKGWELPPESSTSVVNKSKHQNTSSENTRQLHIAYHGGDHYDSVRKVNDTSHLPANIVLNVDNSNKKETCERSSTHNFFPDETEEANKQELEAMERSGCENLFLVREFLLNNCGNLEAAVEDLIAISQINLSSTGSKLDDFHQAHSSGKTRCNLNKKQLEKIRKHERKRARENRKKCNKLVDIPDETVIISKVQCLNI